MNHPPGVGFADRHDPALLLGVPSSWMSSALRRPTVRAPRDGRCDVRVHPTRGVCGIAGPNVETTAWREQPMRSPPPDRMPEIALPGQSPASNRPASAVGHSVLRETPGACCSYLPSPRDGAAGRPYCREPSLSPRDITVARCDPTVRSPATATGASSMCETSRRTATRRRSGS